MFPPIMNLFEHLQWCSVCDHTKVVFTSKSSYLLFSNPAHKTKTGIADRWETTNSNPPGPIKLSSQPTAGVRLWCAFYKPLHPLQKCWAKTILLSQTGHVLTFLHPIFFCRATYWALVELLLKQTWFLHIWVALKKLCSTGTLHWNSIWMTKTPARRSIWKALVLLG